MKHSLTFVLMSDYIEPFVISEYTLLCVKKSILNTYFLET